MIAVRVESPNRLEIVTEEIRAPASGEVLIRVKKGGICGSDIHILHGSNPFARYPRIIGHEISGVVEEVGPGVEGLAAGDRVVVDPVTACGRCYPCRIGRPNVCAKLEVLGVHRDGGFRTRLVVPAANAIRHSPTLPSDIAALAEPFSIAANVLERTGCEERDTVIVYGTGPIGLTVLQVAKLLGARCLVADIDPSRLGAAAEFGADKTIHAVPGAVAESAADENDGLGPTLVIDAAGAPALLEEAVALVSPAGRIGLLGFSSQPSTLVQKDIMRKEISIHGSRLSRRLLPRVVAWLQEGKLDPGPMITHTFPAEEASAAFDFLEKESSTAIKVQLDF